MRRIVVAGASRGIGSAVAAHYAAKGDEVLSLSRGEARSGRWLKCDLSQPGEIAAMAGQIGGRIDALLFAGGVWEAGAFTDAYSFAASPPEETAMVLAVNLAAPILLTQALLPLMSDGARVVVIGSLSGLDNTATVEVANSASKYGIRGAARALALSLQPQGVGVTVINPGNIATEEVVSDIAEGRFDDQVPIPMTDLLAAFDFALTLSPATVVREINLAQMRG